MWDCSQKSSYRIERLFHSFSWPKTGVLLFSFLTFWWLFPATGGLPQLASYNAPQKRASLQAPTVKYIDKECKCIVNIIELFSIIKWLSGNLIWGEIRQKALMGCFQLLCIRSLFLYNHSLIHVWTHFNLTSKTRVYFFRTAVTNHVIPSFFPLFHHILR